MQDCQIRPLALRLDAKMGADFLERGLHTRQRETNQPRMVAGVTSRSVLRKAEGSRSPVGSRTSTQRIGTGGMPE